MNDSIKNKMKTFTWLVKREFWENKGLFLWAPLAICVGFSLLFLVMQIWGKGLLDFEFHAWEKKTFGDVEATTMKIRYTTAMVVDFSQSILQISLSSCAFFSAFYLFSSLSGERRDRSILFWKSLPVSDVSTVLAKLIFPLLLSPLIGLIFGSFSYILMTLIVACLSVFGPVNMFSAILGMRDLYSMPLEFLALLPFYILWALPTVGWFLLTSSWAKSRVFPWAVGLPILSTLVLAFIDKAMKLNWDIAWFVKHVLARVIASQMPGQWIMEVRPEQLADVAVNVGRNLFMPEMLLKSASLCLQSPSVWLGAIGGLVMIFAAVRIRRFSDVAD